MKKYFLLLVTLIFNFSPSNAQCPFNLGPDVMICIGTPVFLNGPSGPVTYLWSTGDTTQAILIFNQGIYWLTITDTASISCTDTIIINFSPPLNVNLTCINNSCTQCTDGGIIASPLGGIQPFSYLWSNGSITANITNLSSGTYTITVTDGYGCTATASCEIYTGPVGTGPNLVSGNVFFDLDSNGVKGAGESGIPYAELNLSPDGLTCYTDTAGNYGFLTDTGSHVIAFALNPGMIITTGSGNYAVQVVSGNYPGYDFGVKGQNAGGFIKSYLNTSNPRCGTIVPYVINTFAFCHSNALHGMVRLIADSAIIFNNAIPAPSAINGDTITWYFTPNNGTNQLQFTCNFELPLQAGYPFYTLLETVLLDSNNTLIFSDFDSLHQVIGCSFDPNDKRVEPDGIAPQHYVFIDYTPSLDYTIRFQNTGNDTAYTVVILDTLDMAFDLSTFSFLGSSHPVQITRLNNLVEFRFEQIFLPDSNVNEPASHGFVRFKCNPVYQGFAYALENSAAIYFDLNPPVITNTTLSTIEISVGIDDLIKSGSGTFVIPNPISTQATVFFENPSFEKHELFIYDLNSRLISKLSSTGNTFSIDSDGLNDGIYLFRIQNDSQSRVFNDKFVIIKGK